MTKQIRFFEASVILILMLIILGTSVIGFQMTPTVPVLAVIGCLMGWLRWRGFSWEELMAGIKAGISTAIIPIFIFMLIGTLIAVWIQAGVIPALMLVGFRLINASFFLPSVFIVCSLVGSAIGSGFTTISTIGIALFGMGSAMGFSPALTAGAIISGAVFGDKMSPLSDSTNLAAAITGSDLFAHIKNMLWTTLPAFALSLLAYTFLGWSHHAMPATQVAGTLVTLQTTFFISGWTMLPILLMLVCSWRKLPAIPTLFLNIAVTIGLIFMTERQFTLAQLTTLIQRGYVAKTGDATLNTLLSRGGIDSMMGTVALIITTLALGGILMNCKIIDHAMAPIAVRLKTPGRLVLSTILAGIGINLFVGEQYLSVILPGNAFKASFTRLKLAPLALSRVLEDGGSVINYLIPWGVAGSFAAGALGVPVTTFLPFAFFSLLSPLFSVLSGVTGWGLKKQATVETV